MKNLQTQAKALLSGVKMSCWNCSHNVSSSWNCSHKYNILMMEENLCKVRDAVCPASELCSEWENRET